MKKVLKALAKDAREKDRLIVFRLTEAEYRKIERLAGWYADGNVSGWCRWSALNMEPYEKELVPLKPKATARSRRKTEGARGKSSDRKGKA